MPLRLEVRGGGRGGALCSAVYDPAAAADRGGTTGVVGGGVLGAAQAGPVGQEAPEGDGTVCVDERRGEVVLAWVHIQG